MRTASRPLLRGFLLTAGGAAAVVLGAGAAFAGTLTVTYTGAANPTTNTPLTWSVSQNPAGPMSCQLDYGATVVFPLADCGPSVTYSVAGKPAGTYTLVAYGDSAANVTGTTKTLSSSVAVAPVAPTPSGPTGPSNNRAPQWALGLPAGATGACTLTTSTGTVVGSADPCPDPWTGPLGTATDGTYTLSVIARQGGLTSAPGTLKYTLDTTAPNAATVTPPASPGNSRTPGFTLSGVEAGATVTCAATGPGGAAPVTSCTSTSAVLGLTGQPEGTYRLDVVVTDVAGNPSTTASANYVLDVTPPPDPTISTPPALTRQKTMTLTIGDAEAGVRLTCVLTSPGGSTVFSGACPANGTFDTTGFPDGVYTLVVTASDAAGNTSSSSVSWQRDTTPPPAPLITGATPTNDRTPSLAVSDSEAGVTFDCAVAGPSPAAVTACGTTTTLDLTGAADGDYVVMVTATDAAGNSRSSSFTLTLDTTAPPAPLITGPGTPVNDRTPSLSVSDAESAVTFTCSVSGPDASAAVSACGATTTVDLTSAADGDYVVTVTAADAAGNTSSSAFTVTLDTVAPPAPTVSSPASLTRSTSVTVSISDDESGVNLSCLLTDPHGATVYSGICPGSGTFSTSGFADGLYTLVVTATDAAGNSSSTTVTWTRDTVPPPAPSVTAPVSPAQGRSPSFSVSDAEAGVVFTCTVTGPSTVTVTSCGATTTLDLTGAADGTYVLHVTATDAAGNTSTAGSASYVLDTTVPPAPSVTAPVSPAQGRTPSFSVSDAEGGVSFTCTVSGPSTVTITSCGATTTVSLTGAADGTYTVTVVAVDAAGNSSAPTSATYVLDTTAPPAPAVDGVSTLTDSRTVTAAISDGESGVRLTCVLTAPGGSVVRSGVCPADGVFDTTGFGDGVYTLRVTATDAAGNSSTTTVTWTRDTIAPPAPTVTAPRSPAQNRTPSFTVTDAEAGVTYICSVAGPSPATVTSCGPTTRLSIQGADGVYTVTVSVVDAAGNISSSTTASYVLDTTAPAEPTVGVTPSPGQGRHPSFTVTGVETGGVVTCTLSTPSGSSVTVPVSCAPGVTLDLTGQPDGRYTLTVTVTDSAGNVSVAGVATYVLDTTAPAAPGVIPPPNPSNDVSPTFTLSTEPGATLTCTIARFFQTVWTGPCPADGTLDLSGYADGEFEVTVFATDAAGNVGPSTTATYLLDTVAPDQPVLTAPASPSPVTNPTWMWTTEAGATSTCTLTDSSGVVIVGPVDCTSPWSVDLSGLPDDSYTFSVVATDAAGNVSVPATSVFVLDRQAPIPPTVVPPASPDNDTSPTWQISGPRNAVLTCTLLQGRKVIWGPAACPSSGTFSLAGLPDGTYTLRVTATDRAGNVSAASVTSYVLDTVAPPSPTLDYGSASPSTDTSPFWGFTLPPGTTGRCELLRNGTVIASRSSCGGAVRFDLSGRPDGTYVVKIYAIDAAGNVSQPLVITYVLGKATALPPSSGTVSGTGTTAGPPTAGGSHDGGGSSQPGLPTAPGAARQPLDEINRLSSLIKAGAKHTVQGAAAAVSAVIPVIHDKITENVSHAVQGVVNAVSSAGGGTGFPLILLFLVLAFLVVQNRIDSRDPKLALASVAADDTVEFLPPPSRGGHR
ncbi:MAG TPA: Ig-like domain-containing protein [Mycobacteriales bacterium]|nr:Ig-like domain-containing protein [Mycobacteriales bacterium]